MMKRVLLSFVLCIPVLFLQPVLAQENADTRLFRAYEDNDFINVRGKGTDNAYTNGTRFDLFYTKKNASRFILDRKMPKAGDSSIDVFGWGIMQTMFTPNDITKTTYQPDDYPYSGALFATHTLYSYNPEEKYSFQTELLVGVMGPAAMAKQTQVLLHQLIHYQRPMGWANQLGNDPLININFTAEKQLAGHKQWIEVIGGGQVFYGTMMNGVALYPLIRIGKMNPYFNGYIGQYSGGVQKGAKKRRNKMQAYFIIKPEAQFIFTNALLEGGLFANNNYNYDGKDVPKKPYSDLQKLVYSLNFGAVMSSGNFGMSFIQNSSSSMMKGTYSHEVGNISLYFSW